MQQKSIHHITKRWVRLVLGFGISSLGCQLQWCSKHRCVWAHGCGRRWITPSSKRVTLHEHQQQLKKDEVGWIVSKQAWSHVSFHPPWSVAGVWWRRADWRVGIRIETGRKKCICQKQDFCSMSEQRRMWTHSSLTLFKPGRERCRDYLCIIGIILLILNKK